MVKIHATKKPLQVDLGHRARHGPDGVYFGWQRLDAVRSDGVAKKLDAGGRENTLLTVYGEAGVPEAGKELPDVEHVDIVVWTCYCLLYTSDAADE